MRDGKGTAIDEKMEKTVFCEDVRIGKIHSDYSCIIDVKTQ